MAPMELRWQQLNSAFAIGQTLGFRRDDASESTVFDIWKKIKTPRLRLPTPEDLIIMKAIARRPKDLADIKAIAGSHPGLDIERIHFWVEQFGEALNQSDLWELISQLL